MTVPNARTAGFSLIEMLVSLAVLGIAAALLATGIGRIGLSLDLADKGDSRVDTVATAQFVLRHRLASAVPVADAQAGAGTIDFAGLDNRVDFLAEPAEGDRPDALHYFRIARDPGGDLTLFSANSLDQRVDAHNAATVGWTARPLVSGTAAIEIRYLGQNAYAPAQGLVWQDNWSHRATLPQLVRVRVSFPPGDPRTWPDLIVRPHGTVADPCAVAPGDAGCAPVKAVAA
ncbi:PulJ/GspJ family protein [Novosphingobium sp.]|uniref:PulJ/GspJ family protein n=1 Tax=Novosphingobium sp. TaxID=1874826 RepID=UPI003B5195C9